MRQRKNLRLKYYDYSQNGGYFITICTHNKQHLFGHIQDAEMILNPIGQIILDNLEAISNKYPNSGITNFVIMPNHLHFIWQNQDDVSLSDVVKAFKGSSATAYRQYIKEKRLDFYPLWQRSFYEHIIRDEADYLRIVQYIDNNPLQWQLDCFYTDNFYLP